MAQRTPRNQYEERPLEPRRTQDHYRSSASGRTGTNSGRNYRMTEEERRRRTSARPSEYGERDLRSRPPAGRNRRRRKGHGGLIAVIVVLAILAVGAVVVWKTGVLSKTPEVTQVVDTRPLPAAPSVAKTATIGATGDILLHGPILDRHITATGDYDFTFCFSNVAKVYQEPDYMIANLEVTLGGPEYGDYIGYPVFNSPDSIVAALKGAGVDMCLTANNHTNDTGYNGIMRTQQVIDEYGLDHIGTRESTDDHYLFVKEINGIRLGMLCYTYDTREYTEGEMSLNLGYLSDEAIPKVHTFNYLYLDEFYSDLQQQLDYMDMLNVDASVVFLHWGTEYEDEPNADQQAIAQRLCDMGVDVIIGGHPHEIQKFDTLKSSNGHEMIVLYSMGNELSNQRKALMDPESPEGYSEDGLVIEVTFEKFNNGNVKVGAVDIIPTWVELDDYGYQIIALDNDQPASWGATDTYSAIESYNRTIGRVGEAYTEFRARKNQPAIVTYLE